MTYYNIYVCVFHIHLNTKIAYHMIFTIKTVYDGLTINSPAIVRNRQVSV